MQDIDMTIPDVELLIKLESERMKFYDVMNRKNIVKKMIELIDDLNGVDFITKRARKFINESRPRFILHMTDDFVYKFNSDKNEIIKHVHSEVIRKYIEWVDETISNDINVSELLESLRKIYGEDRIKNHLITVISNMHVDVEKKELSIGLML